MFSSGPSRSHKNSRTFFRLPHYTLSIWLDFHSHHFCSYDFVLIGAWTTNGTQREHLCCHFFTFSLPPTILLLALQLYFCADWPPMIKDRQPSGLDYWSLLTAAYSTRRRSTTFAGTYPTKIIGEISSEIFILTPSQGGELWQAFQNLMSSSNQRR